MSARFISTFSILSVTLKENFEVLILVSAIADILYFENVIPTTNKIKAIA